MASEKVDSHKIESLKVLPHVGCRFSSRYGGSSPPPSLECELGVHVPAHTPLGSETAGITSSDPPRDL